MLGIFFHFISFHEKDDGKEGEREGRLEREWRDISSFPILFRSRLA